MKLLIIDSNYICYKSMLALRGLSYQDHFTGVIFGFLREIQKLATDFDNPKFIFTWDSRKSYRKDVYPEYKKRPEIKDPEMEDLISVGKPQFNTIRTSVLPQLGFDNSFIQVGCEADDIIAWIIHDYSQFKELDITIISGDNDLFQLLHPNVKMYDPRFKKTYTGDWLIEEKNVAPDLWYWVKAVGGCSSDNVKGPKGVAELTAIKHLNGELKGKKKDLIDNFIKSSNFDLNISLVKLPYRKSGPVHIVNDNLDIVGFESVCLNYGFSSLLKKENFLKWRNLFNNGGTNWP